MTIQEILSAEREIWGNNTMTLSHITDAMGTIFGDIARHSRDTHEGKNPPSLKLQKELGNMINSAIRWCDDLGFNPQECVQLSLESHKKYRSK